MGLGAAADKLVFENLAPEACAAVPAADYLYIQMEACDATLQDLIASDVPRPKELAWALLEQILDGLAYVHDHGIIHRDLKPANIFLSFEALGPGVTAIEHLRGLPPVALLRLKAKLGDFGLAKDGTEGPSNATTQCGTPDYMAPEVLEGRPYEAAADIFSLGAVLYALPHPP